MVALKLINMPSGPICLKIFFLHCKSEGKIFEKNTGLKAY